MAIPFFFRNMPDEAAAKANLDIIGIGLLTISIVMFAVYISLYHVFIYWRAFLLDWSCSSYPTCRTSVY
ncbi:hypothetical protein PO124_14985 [Bacillus licheniformis]|nr:hypothetical protein [Bacillus licheniformis]